MRGVTVRGVTVRGVTAHGVCLLLLFATPVLAADDLSSAIQAIRNVGPKGKGHKQAVVASRELAQADASQLTVILAGMDGTGPLAQNWFRGAVDAVAERELRETGKLPAAALEKFVLNAKHAPRARRLAFEWLTRADAKTPDRLMPKFLDDPSLELRRDAVARVIDAAKAESRAAKQIALYQRALAAARDLDQVTACAEALAELKQPVDTAAHLGFLTAWKLIGAFDNTNRQGFAVAYPPEKELDYDAQYQGKVGKVAWFDDESDDPYGIVDFKKTPLGRENKQAVKKYGKPYYKGTIAYAAAEFVANRPRDVQFRLGCINSNKLWLNGELLIANEVYHAGMEVDQYIVDGRLKQGKNTILVKVCQNEQEESWAQRWQFQLRVTDDLGGAILSANR